MIADGWLHSSAVGTTARKVRTVSNPGMQNAVKERAASTRDECGKFQTQDTSDTLIVGCKSRCDGVL